jgi:hypothetical protein
MDVFDEVTRTLVHSPNFMVLRDSTGSIRQLGGNELHSPSEEADWYSVKKPPHGFLIQREGFALFFAMLRGVLFRGDTSEAFFRGVSQNRAVLQPKFRRP